MCAAALFMAASAAPAWAGEGPVPGGVPPLDRVFVIVMENLGYPQIMNNPSAPYINRLAMRGGLAANYFAVGHPSLTNYLEIVGGSNFGVMTDAAPDWHNAACVPDLVKGTTTLNAPRGHRICPIAGSGTDAATPIVYTLETRTGDKTMIAIDGKRKIPPATDVVGKTIADQLVASGRSWRSYQESLPPRGADRVDYSDGTRSLGPAPGDDKSDVAKLYAVKHNPFAYFRNVQQGRERNNSLANVAPFDGGDGLFTHLALGSVPALSFIAPNQCNDHHGLSVSDPSCSIHPKRKGTQDGLNGALIRRGDDAVQRIVRAIEASPVWRQGTNAIVLLWDENDFSYAPNTNQVVTIVLTNYARDERPRSSQFYTHFSLLKSLQAGFRLPCLNHACDADVAVMADLFGR
jgi:hypothetical protein